LARFDLEHQTDHPGLNNEGSTSNVEGVLTRVEDVLRFLSGSLERGRRK
jgi:C4-type Zn-finger protein